MNKRQLKRLHEATVLLRQALVPVDVVWNELSVQKDESMLVAECGDLISMALRRLESLEGKKKK